jgi:hypothetical protein
MKRYVKAVVGAVLATASFGDVAMAAQAWPRLDQGLDDQRCQQALALGRRAFVSSNASLAWPVDLPPGYPSAPVLYRKEPEITGGDAVGADTRVFSQLKPNTALTVFWQSRATDGKRLALVARSHGWRGDAYSLYLVDAGTEPAALDPDSAPPQGDLPYGAWTPPMVLAEAASGGLWFVDFGNDWALGDWRVYAVEGGAVAPLCRVSFHPTTSPNTYVRPPTSGLPPTVRRWATALDEALGQDPDEGNLRPVARIRGAMGLAWMNARYRPWALIATPYNSEREVEAGLRSWAAGSGARTAVYRAIRDQRSGAEAELAAYYGHRFGLPAGQARRASAYVMDYLFRSAFRFHSEDARGPKPKTLPNPWPETSR